MRLTVCHLTKREAHRAEHCDRKPNCGHHEHIPLEKAFHLVREQKARWVKAGWSIVCEVVHWVAKRSGSVKVMQLVSGDVQGSRSAHYPVPAHGARGRDTKVAQVNGVQQQVPGTDKFLWLQSNSALNAG